MRLQKKALATVFEPSLYGVLYTSSHFGPDGEAMFPKECLFTWRVCKMLASIVWWT